MINFEKSKVKIRTYIIIQIQPEREEKENLVVKSSQKIWSENTQKRRPRGSSNKHGEICSVKFGQMCLPLTFQVYLLHLSEL